MKKFSTEHEKKQLEGAARAIIAHHQKHIDETQVKEGYRESHITMVITERNCGGCDPKAVAEKIRDILVKHAYKTVPEWVKRLKEELNNNKNNPQSHIPILLMDRIASPRKSRKDSNVSAVVTEKSLADNCGKSLWEIG